MPEFQEKIQALLDEVWQIIVWQEEVKRDIVIAMIAGWHVLLEWAPWLAKTRTIKSFSEALRLSFQRIQFTPDLLPSDITGAKIYDPDAREFEIKKGPIFANFLLADEINRAPSKVQSALLEAMEERQVTIWEETFSLPNPFMVLATQNPLEQEGTYRLPEAQLDRFLFKTLVEYPSPQQEKKILTDTLARDSYKISKIFWKKEILEMQKHIWNIDVSESIYEYICEIIFASRNSDKYPQLYYWASPRASLALLKTSKIHALMQWRDFVIPEDVKAMSYWVLRHRIILSYESLASWISADNVITKILWDISIR